MHLTAELLEKKAFLCRWELYPVLGWGCWSKFGNDHLQSFSRPWCFQQVFCLKKWIPDVPFPKITTLRCHNHASELLSGT